MQAILRVRKLDVDAQRALLDKKGKCKERKTQRMKVRHVEKCRWRVCGAVLPITHSGRHETTLVPRQHASHFDRESTQRSEIRFKLQ